MLKLFFCKSKSPVRESTPADPDALQDTIASELKSKTVYFILCFLQSNLVHHKGGGEQAGGLVVVGDDTPDEVGVSLVQGGQPGEKKKVRNIFAKIFKLTGHQAGLGTQKRQS